MNFPQSLQRAKTLLSQKHHAQAVQTVASALETLLVELYNELLGKSAPARQKELIEAQEKVGGGQPLNRLTLGKLAGVYRASRAAEDLQKTLGLKLTYLNVNAMEPLIQIRNQAVHEGLEPDPAEAAYIVNQVELILRETGRLPSPARERGVGGEGLTPWWHTAIPHLDIREGRLDPRIFAVDLAQVVEGESKVTEYKDAETFFRRTFPTRGIRATLTGVLRRLAGREDGVAITQMATVFGGGKTHTLLALYHLIANRTQIAQIELVAELLAEAGLVTVPQGKVAAVDCAHISPSQPRTVPEGFTLHTLWGEIAYRLGAPDRGAEFYEIVRLSDESRIAPGSETLERLFRHTGPTLILIDETLSYITKASGIQVGNGFLSDQAQEFLLELTRAVNATDHIALVLTMTSSEQEQIGEAAIRAAREVDTAIRILRRTRQVEVSAEKEELYEILRRRLFDTAPEAISAQARGVAQAFWDYYRAHPNDFPQEVQTPEYRDLMVRAYPFHPALIEILRDRWGSISGFQRTRGVLRLLALVIGDLYTRRNSTPVILPSQVNLDNGKIRAELLEYVDSRGGYESAIFSDIGGTDESKAPYLDRVTGGDYARFAIATGLATTMFLYSHSGATQQAAAAERPQLWLGALQPGVVPALASDALDKLENRLHFLQKFEGNYRIDKEPNLNQMLITRADAIRQEPETIRERVRQAVEEVLGRSPFPAQPIIWPQTPAEIPNQQPLTLVALDLNYVWSQRETGQRKARAFIEEILNNVRNTFRQFKNTLVFVLPTEDGVRVIEDTAVRLLALEGIHRQYRRGGLSANQMDELDTQFKQVREGLPGAVWGAYTVIIAPAGNGNGETKLWVRQEHGFPGYRPSEHSIASRVWKRLMDDQRLLERLDPRLISEGKGDQWRLWAEEDNRINVAKLWDYFCRFPYLPMLTGSEAMGHTIAWGVQRGLFAYALGDGEKFDTVYFQESLPSTTYPIIEGAWLLRPALAGQLLKPKEITVPQPELPPTPPEKSTDGETIISPIRKTTPTPPPATYHRVVIETPVNWQQWYDFYQAVIQPLVEAGVEVRIELKLEATGEVDANLVDLSVKESVVQLNARGRVDVSDQ